LLYHIDTIFSSFRADKWRGMPASGFTGGYSYRTTFSGAFVKSFQDSLSFYCSQINNCNWNL
jgi:hypothetical protein